MQWFYDIKKQKRGGVILFKTKKEIKKGRVKFTKKEIEKIKKGDFFIFLLPQKKRALLLDREAWRSIVKIIVEKEVSKKEKRRAVRFCYKNSYHNILLNKKGEFVL